MLSHEARCIFVHQRKCAGTTVKALFADAIGADRRLFNNGILDPAWRERPDLIEAYFKFTVVRNPWDRFVSGWKYCGSTRGRSLKDVLRNLPQPNLWANILAPGASLASRWHSARELVRRSRSAWRHAFDASVLGRAAPPPPDQGHDFRHLTRQQHESVVYPDGRLAVDRVVYFEDLEAGLSEVFAVLGRPLPSLSRMKATRRGDDYRQYFDAEARRLFDAAFGQDIAIWGYDFESGVSRRMAER